MKTYRAKSFGVAFVDEGGISRALDPRLDLRNHSPTGFAFGYAGSGPCQFALAILCDAYDDEKALRLYPQFTVEAIAPKPKDQPFVMTLDEVMKVVEKIEPDDSGQHDTADADRESAS